MFYPSLEQAKTLASENKVIPVSMELFADQKTSVEVLRNLSERNTGYFMLESVTGSENWGRYSFLGYAPRLTAECRNGTVTVTNQFHQTTQTGDPVQVLRQLLADFKSPHIASLPPFTGGLVGYFSYDFIPYCIPGLHLKEREDNEFPACKLMLIDRVIAYDHFKQKIFLIVNVSAEDIENSYINGVSMLKDMQRMIMEPVSGEIEPMSCGEFSPQYSKKQFYDMVGRVKEHIKEGDIFQAVISNRFTARCSGNLLQSYRRLRTSNPSPYMVFMKIGDVEIACASPETLITLRNGKLSSFPLAGTRPRGSDEEQDRALSESLLQDEKELAEHNMLVDLARNDVGKVSGFGSVKVAEYLRIKSYAHVMHMSSHVTGRLRGDLDALDALTAAFPAGTLSGAPKKRACEIIDDLETCARGLYGGAIGYIDFAGNMDLCIGIRMAVRKGNEVFVQAGAGIVSDSVPEKEYEEIGHKSRGIMQALQGDGR